MMAVDITALTPMQVDVAENMIADGIVQRVGDTLELTEKGYELVGTEAGWARGEDQDGDDCFVHTESVHTYSYVETWKELCLVYRLLDDVSPRGLA